MEMDLKRKYKEETGKIPTEIGGGHYTDDYVDWLESQIQPPVPSLLFVNTGINRGFCIYTGEHFVWLDCATV
jgi:hypothetical protein